ncbi:MAG: hypothetical protein MMC23_001708 [Stictis urceolatum]|nr:hypothetical protein [Stictis urceolata]
MVLISRYMSAAGRFCEFSPEDLIVIWQSIRIPAHQHPPKLEEPHTPSKEYLTMSSNDTAEKATEVPTSPVSTSPALSNESSTTTHSITSKTEHMTSLEEGTTIESSLGAMQDLIAGFQTQINNLQTQNNELREDNKQLLTRMGYLEANLIHRTETLHKGITLLLENTDTVRSLVSGGNSASKPSSPLPPNTSVDMRSHVPFTCHICGVSFLDMERLQRHFTINKHKSPPPPPPPPVHNRDVAAKTTCLVCKQQFPSSKELNTHIHAAGHLKGTPRPRRSIQHGTKRNGGQKPHGSPQRDTAAKTGNLIDI